MPHPNKHSNVIALSIGGLALISAILLYLGNPQSEAIPFPIQEKLASTSQQVNTILPAIEPKKPNRVSMVAVGDMMLDRSVWLKTRAAQDYNHPFVLVDDLFEDHDIRLGNLEGPITTYPSIANGTGGARFSFTFSPEFVEPLKKRFSILSLANNHTHNFGQDGLSQTRTYLDNADILYFGDPWNSKENISATTMVNNISFAFVGYHQLIGQGLDRVIEEIEQLDEKVDMLIVMPHWGIEYVEDRPSALQRQEAHAFIDAGADVVIGAHPHVIQPIEQYNDKFIFYSLGNFIFDQYFSEETMRGLALELDIEENEETINIRYHLIPIRINSSSQAFIAEADYAQSVLSEMAPFSIGDGLETQVASGSLYSSWPRSSSLTNSAL